MEPGHRTLCPTEQGASRSPDAAGQASAIYYLLQESQEAYLIPQNEITYPKSQIWAKLFSFQSMSTLFCVAKVRILSLFCLPSCADKIFWMLLFPALEEEGGFCLPRVSVKRKMFTRCLCP